MIFSTNPEKHINMSQAHVIVPAWHLVCAICCWFYSIFHFIFYFFRINFNIFIKSLSIHVRLQVSRILVLYSYKWFLFFVFLSWYILFAKKKIFSKRTSFWGIGSPITLTLPGPPPAGIGYWTSSSLHRDIFYRFISLVHGFQHQLPSVQHSPSCAGLRPSQRDISCCSFRFLVPSCLQTRRRLLAFSCLTTTTLNPKCQRNKFLINDWFIDSSLVSQPRRATLIKNGGRIMSNPNNYPSNLVYGLGFKATAMFILGGRFVRRHHPIIQEQKGSTLVLFCCSGIRRRFFLNLLKKNAAFKVLYLLILNF